MASSPAGCASIFHVLLLSFLAALARMSQIFLPAELLCWFGSAFAVSETASGKVQRKKRSSRVKANKAPVPAGWRRPSLSRSHRRTDHREDNKDIVRISQCMQG